MSIDVQGKLFESIKKNNFWQFWKFNQLCNYLGSRSRYATRYLKFDITKNRKIKISIDCLVYSFFHFGIYLFFVKVFWFLLHIYQAVLKLVRKTKMRIHFSRKNYVFYFLIFRSFCNFTIKTWHLLQKHQTIFSVFFGTKKIAVIF